MHCRLEPQHLGLSRTVLENFLLEICESLNWLAFSLFAQWSPQCLDLSRRFSGGVSCLLVYMYLEVPRLSHFPRVFQSSRLFTLILAPVNEPFHLISHP